jgi:hypothetical protein
MVHLQAKKSRLPKSHSGAMKLDGRVRQSSPSNRVKSPAVFHYVQQGSAVVQIDTGKQAATSPASRQNHAPPPLARARLRKYKSKALLDQGSEGFVAARRFALGLLEQSVVETHGNSHMSRNITFPVASPPALAQRSPIM